MEERPHLNPHRDRELQVGRAEAKRRNSGSMMYTPTELKRFRAGSAPDRFEAQGDSVVAAKVESVASRVPTLQTLAWRALPGDAWRALPEPVHYDLLSRNPNFIPNRPPPIGASSTYFPFPIPRTSGSAQDYLQDNLANRRSMVVPAEEMGGGYTLYHEEDRRQRESAGRWAGYNWMQHGGAFQYNALNDNPDTALGFRVRGDMWARHT